MSNQLTTTTETLINRGLSINTRSINLVLSQLFQRYQTALGKIAGDGLVGSCQVKRILNAEGVAVPYAKGGIAVRNGIDKLTFLLDHKKEVAEAIGLPSSSEIQDNARDLGKVKGYLSKMDSRYDLGEPGSNMQLFISRKDGNTSPLDFQADWVDYILTREWVDKLARSTASISGGAVESDFRIGYLSDMVHGMMKDHETDFHVEDALGRNEFDESEFLDSGSGDRLADALGRLNSIGKLDYTFYEIFKPIGGGSGKYIKAKVSTTGEVDISGVVGLSDCEHVAWDYGSNEYLRSLNTGNQRYDLRLDIPINDGNGVLWWKPDGQEAAGDGFPPGTLKYFKPYETERFLRWFGTSNIPRIDPRRVTKLSVCQSPSLPNDVQGNKFFDDATNITGANIQENTSQSLLSLAPRATARLVEDNGGEEEEGGEGKAQVLSFTVAGNQQTSTLAFNVRGMMDASIQEPNHYAHTLGLFDGFRTKLAKAKLLFVLSSSIFKGLERTWGILFQGVDWVPGEWQDILDALGRLREPGTIDLLRMRQVDIELVDEAISADINLRLEFLERIDGNAEHVEEYAKEVSGGGGGDEQTAEKVVESAAGNAFLVKELRDYIREFGSGNPNLPEWYAKIPLDDARKAALDGELVEIARTRDSDKYNLSFGDMTTDELRDRIQTFNNLIVRLPPDPTNPEMMADPYRYNMVSRHIFLDWKTFVDGTVAELVKNGESGDADIPDNKKLHVKRGTDGEPEVVKGIGTDGVEHAYIELYTDQECTIPLVDYSYIEVGPDEDGVLRANHDRWDYWDESDFE